MFPCKYANRDEADIGSQIDITTLLMHVHILTKVWYQKWADWYTQAVLHSGTHVSM